MQGLQFSRNFNFCLFILDVVLLKLTNQPIFEIIAYFHIALFAIASWGVYNVKK